MPDSFDADNLDLLFRNQFRVTEIKRHLREMEACLTLPTDQIERLYKLWDFLGDKLAQEAEDVGEPTRTNKELAMTAVCTVGPKVCAKKGVNFPKKDSKGVGFDNPTKLVGTSKWKGSDGQPITVYYDPSLGSNGAALAQDILANRIDDIMAYCDDAFQTRGMQGDVIIVPGNSGAYHAGCDWNPNSGAASDWYEDDMGTSPPPASSPGGLVAGLVMAEVCESYMGSQNKGWDCGGSGGEALSRIIAETASGGINGAMSGGFSARSSYDGSDWISRDQGTDQDYPSIGCGMLYLDWMRSQGFTLQQIIQAGESDGTLAGNYATLTGKPKSQAWSDFQTAIRKVDINAANPFNIKDSPYPLGSGPTPPPPPPPTGLGTLAVTSPLAPGNYLLMDSGTVPAVYGNLTVMATVPVGSYPITGSNVPPAAAIITVPGPLPSGSYTIPSVGGLLLTTPLQAGVNYVLEGPQAGHGPATPPKPVPKIDREKLIALLKEWVAVPVPATAAEGLKVDGMRFVTLQGLIQDALSWLNANPGPAAAIPPFILALLKFLCILAPSLPAPYGTIAAGLCALLPA